MAMRVTCCAAMGFLLSCTDSTRPVVGDCEPARRGSWEFLGLEEHQIRSVGATPWGVFVGTFNGGIFRLNESSGEWLSLGLDHAIVQTMLFVPSDPPKLLVGVSPRGEAQTQAALFMSTDQGESWIPWDGGLAANRDWREWAYSLAYDPGDHSRMYMGHPAALSRSTDGGLSWTYLIHEGYIGNGINGVVVSPDRSGRVYMGGTSAFSTAEFFHSDDWGDTWEHVPVDIQSGVGLSALFLDERDTRRIWAAAGALRYSTDYGRTWQFAESPFPWSPRSLLAHRDTWYAVGGGMQHQAVLLCSADRGASWTSIDVPAGAHWSDAAAVDAAGRLFIGTRLHPTGGMWRLTPAP